MKKTTYNLAAFSKECFLCTMTSFCYNGFILQGPDAMRVTWNLLKMSVCGKGTAIIQTR